MRKSIIAGINIVSIALAVTGMGFTGAYFNDEESSRNNAFTAGAIDLLIGNHSYYNGVEVAEATWVAKDLDGELIYDFDDVKPGDLGENTIDLVVNDNESWVCADMVLTANDDNTCLEPELLDDPTCTNPGLGEGELAESINFLWWADDGDNVYEAGEVVIAQDALTDSMGVPIADSSFSIEENGALAPGQTYYVGQAWCFGDITLDPVAPGNNDPTVDPGFSCDGAPLDNATQSDSAMVDLSFTAVQARHNTDYQCPSRVRTPHDAGIVLHTSTTYYEHPTYGPMVADILIVVFETGTSVERITEIADEVGATIAGSLNDTTYFFQFTTDFSENDVDELLATLDTYTEVVLALPDVFLNLQELPRYTAPDIDNSINADLHVPYDMLHWSEGYRALQASNEVPYPVQVAVVDTGVDIAHDDLSANVIASLNDYAYWDFANNDGVMEDTDGHGTAVAGVIAGRNNDNNYNGIAPQARIFPLKVSNNASPLLSRIGAAIEYAVKANVDVINLSVGGTVDPFNVVGRLLVRTFLKNAIDKALTAGVVVVAGAGNSGNHVSTLTTNVEGVLLIGAVDSAYERSVWSATQSSGYGDNLVGAPGSGVYTTRTGGGYRLFDGTSAAAPYVSGVTALLLQIEPRLTPIEIADILVETGKQIHVTDPDGTQLLWVVPDVYRAVCDVLGTNHTVCADAEEVVGIIGGVVRDATTNEPIAGVNLQFLRDGITLPLESLGSTTSSAFGSFLIELPATRVKILAQKEGYLDTEQYVDVSANASTQVEVTLVVPGSDEDVGSIAGMVTDAVTGSAISGATLALRPGIGNTIGSVVHETTTLATGSYGFSDIPAGMYTALVTAGGYATNTLTVAVIGGETGTFSTALSPELGDEEMRIILTWGEVPRDLDSHLTGPMENSSDRFHIAYYNKGSLTSAPYAMLDYDDTSSYGPETVTIIKRVTTGTYKYEVHDFTNGNSDTSSEMSNSGAQVKIFAGFLTEPIVYNIPPSTPGTLWEVFEMDGATRVITPGEGVTFDDPGGVPGS